MNHPDDLNCLGRAIAEGIAEIMDTFGEGTKYVLVLFPAGSTECPCGEPHVFVATNSTNEARRALEQASEHIGKPPDVTFGEAN